jgi:hypothetical protein
MGGLRSTVVLLVVLAGLGGYIYFVDANRDPAALDANPRAFVELSADDIEEVQIRSDGGETSRVQRVGENWQLIEPSDADADAGVVGTVTSSLASLEVQRVVDEQPADLSQYGLEPARIDVAFRLEGQEDFEHLLVGEQTPTGGDLFARRPNETRVFLISFFLDSIFNKTAFDLRDKAVLKFERDTAEGVELVGNSTRLQFTKSGATWRIVDPIAARADYAAVEGLITALSSTQMQRVVAQDASDLRGYGLDSPVMTATVAGGDSTASLIIGNQEEGERFAKDAERPEVFAVAESLLTDLSKGVSEYRRKDILDARSFTATRIETRRGDETLTLERTSTDADATWQDASGQDVDITVVDDLLTKLSGLRALAFEEPPPPAPEMPALTVTIEYDGDNSETVTFVRSAIDVFAARSDELGFARIDAMLFDGVLMAVDASQ